MSQVFQPVVTLALNEFLFTSSHTTSYSIDLSKVKKHNQINIHFFPL